MAEKKEVKPVLIDGTIKKDVTVTESIIFTLCVTNLLIRYNQNTLILTV